MARPIGTRIAVDCASHLYAEHQTVASVGPYSLYSVACGTWV